MTDLTTTIDEIRGWHRKRRFAMKVQQKLDRSLESFFRVNATEWNPNASDEEREKANKKVRDLIKKIRAGLNHPLADEVRLIDHARAPADERRKVSEKEMEKAARELPVFPWVEGVHGAGTLGLATIVAEAGDLSKYSTPAKLWKRLGYAPYDGHAGSTWKRKTWRPRQLTAEEWIANPFSGERYALMAQIATWLVNTQVEAAEKSGTKFGRPKGEYGKLYVHRREHTAKAHPDWTDGHCRSDALRFTMKAFLKNLCQEWKRVSKPVESKPVVKRRARRRAA